MASKPSPLLALPSELVHHILSHLDLYDLLSISLVCHALHSHSTQDILWQAFVHAQSPSIICPASLTWRQLYSQHHPYWFLVRQKLWFADTPHTGKLIVARYDHRLNSIEAYALVAERRQPTFQTWEYNPDAIIHTFNPRVQLDLNSAVVRLNLSAYAAAIGNMGVKLQKEIPMDTSSSTSDGFSRQSANIYSRLILTRPWPPAITSEATPVWPPLTLPSAQRTRNDPPPSGFTQPGQKPNSFSALSTSTFRIRRWMEFSTRPLGVSMRIGEDITTFATLPPSVYTPTAQKPWQGIWCGDYAGHGCEFLVVMQPDDPHPLPERAEWALRARERDGSVSSGESWSTAPTDADTDADSAYSDQDPELEDGEQSASDLEDSVMTLHGDLQRASSTGAGPVDSSAAGQEDESIYRGRIEAVKLTGDPNIPRGEYTFIAPDIGPAGLLRVAREDIFKGARIVKSVGHIAARGFRDDNYITSQLILISHDRLAQYWETFGHVSFYQRVKIDAFTKV
ncbi:similar to F-box domain protein [Plenodomus lingam JN3]|uniref:Similar to F-box domain protein n=1 Tax=Leptosphaeria maculans (strain JN3 / isolate v23.1.3 / race Av1-4-5-6-7-8) TaxID=985895 RepID=E4ZTX7_LEPMJ|nr:similar to F-box domain protein [Plenodomus lingam JN3]CBX94687.1 similar to F-box domain protein [Plenodomus lingam JN3]